MVARAHPLEPMFGGILNDISRLARKEFDRRVRDLGITRSQWLVLMHLARQPGCTQSELAEAMQMQKITVSRHVERLLRGGWIERRDDPDDARAYRLHLRPRTEPLIGRVAAMAEEMRLEYMRGLPGSRRSALVSDLLQIKSNLVRMDAATR